MDYTPASYLMLAVLLGIATRRVCRLVAQDTILDAWRMRFLARWPRNGAMGLDWRYVRWFPAQDFAGVPEAQRPALRGRLHGRHGYWQPVQPPLPTTDDDGDLTLPVLDWDRKHEGSMPHLHYPPRPEAWVSKLLMCPWCLSVWVGTGAVVAWFHAAGLLSWDRWPELVLTSLATWQVAGLVSVAEGKLAG